VLLLKGDLTKINGLKIYPNIVSASANLNIDANTKQQGLLLISDFSGRIVRQQSLNLQEGNNTLQLTDLDRLPSGNYVAAIRMAEGMYCQKITIR
jgi:hypothetical protein